MRSELTFDGACVVKNFLIGVLSCIVVALVIGFEPLERAINETLHMGTVRGVENCIDYSSSGLLSDESIRETCTIAFQRRLFHNDHATGRAGPRANRSSVDWEGVLENRTSDHVTTWVEVAVSVFDEDGVEQEFTAETSIWIDPLSEAEFRVELRDFDAALLDELEFCERDAGAPTSCMTWGVVGMMGLSI